MRSFFSFISVSVAAPTLMTATPPDSLARRSCSFSLSYSEVVVSIWARICAMRLWMSSLAPAPSTMVGGLLGDLDLTRVAKLCQRGVLELHAEVGR